MTDIEFLAPFGNEFKEVKLSFLQGKSEYQLYVNKYYWGSFRLVGGCWGFYSNNPGVLGPDDVKSMVERIEQGYRVG